MANPTELAETVEENTISNIGEVVGNLDHCWRLEKEGLKVRDILIVISQLRYTLLCVVAELYKMQSKEDQAKIRQYIRTHKR